MRHVFVSLTNDNLMIKKKLDVASVFFFTQIAYIFMFQQLCEKNSVQKDTK